MQPSVEAWIRDAASRDGHALRRESGLGGVTLEDVERLLFTLGTFPHDAVHRARSPEPATDLAGLRAEDAYRAFADGSTLIVRSAHQRLPATARLAGDLGRRLGLEVRANLYLTPPRSQGFGAHFDSHDVLVLQLQGEKHWNVFPHVGHRPLSPSLLSTPQKLLVDTVLAPEGSFSREPVEALEVAPGDLLFIPRGVPHQAAAAEGPSLHCTFALLHPSRAEALSLAVFAGAAADAEMLESWDPAVAPAASASGGDGPGWEVGYTLELLRQQSRIPLPDRYLRTLCALDAIDASTVLERRPGVHPWVGAVDGGRQFLFGEHRFWIPPELEETFAFLVSHERFPAGELPIARAGFDPVELCRDLVRRGLLQLAG